MYYKPTHPWVLGQRPRPFPEKVNPSALLQKTVQIKPRKVRKSCIDIILQWGARVQGQCISHKRSIYRLVDKVFLPDFSAKPVSSNLCLNVWYFSKLVPAHRWQKRSSVGTNELRGNGPFGAFFNETRKRWRGRILWSRDKLRYIGYFVKDWTSFLRSLTK